jgi:hypothetical protein
MARGFDSKDVESQIEQREADRKFRSTQPTHDIDVERQARRESLLLSRSRVISDLASARHPRHRAQLEAALAFLDSRIADLAGEPAKK